MKRGCRNDLTLLEAQQCSNQSDSCKICNNGNNCKYTKLHDFSKEISNLILKMTPIAGNARLHFQECHECNSRNHPQCSRDPRATRKSICDSYYSSCLTGIDQYGHTHRRCIADHEIYNLDLPVSFKYYTICTDNGCNDQIYPEDRLQCIQCNGEKNCNLIESTKSSMKPEPCKILSKYDQCFTYINKEGNDKKTNKKILIFLKIEKKI